MSHDPGFINFISVSRTAQLLLPVYVHVTEEISFLSPGDVR